MTMTTETDDNDDCSLQSHLLVPLTVVAVRHPTDSATNTNRTITDRRCFLPLIHLNKIVVERQPRSSGTSAAAAE